MSIVDLTIDRANVRNSKRNSNRLQTVMSQGNTASRGVPGSRQESEPNLGAREWYRYEPLDLKNRKAIRVLRVKSALRDGLIDCELWPTSLKSKYSTLSYVCGTAENPKTILLNGRLASIYENLWQFLSIARRHLTDRVLWIDATSIAQDDLQEKSHQVQMMSRIYSESQEVLVWLGTDSSQAAYALEIIRDFPSMSDEERYRSHATDAHFRQGFREVLDAPYWRRAWIVQEYILPRTGLLAQGETWVSLDVFNHTVGTTFRGLCKHSGASDYHSMLEQLHYDIKLYETCEELVETRRRYTGKARRDVKAALPLLGLQLERRRCKDIRDRVFAMLAFTTHGHTFKVNYELTPLELLFESIWLEYKVANDPFDNTPSPRHQTIGSELPATALNRSTTQQLHRLI